MLILNSLNNKSLYINYKYCIKLFTTHIHGDMSSNYLLSASEHSPKFVCILSKSFQKIIIIIIIVPGLGVAEGEITSLGFPCVYCYAKA